MRTLRHSHEGGNLISKLFLRLIIMFGFFVIITPNLWSETPDAGNNCNSATTVAFAIGSTTIVGTSPNGDSDFYKITAPSGGGVLRITTSSPNSHSYNLNIGSTCVNGENTGAEYYQSSSSAQSHTINEIPLSGGSVVYFYVRESGSDTDNYQLNLTLTDETDINVQGSGVTIVDGDTTPSTTDDTDFGNVVSGSYLDKTYTIQNLGSDDLTIGAFTLPAGFSLLSPPASTTLIPGSSTTFAVRFSPTATNTTYSGSLSFVNNDSNENPYNFNITGKGVEFSEACPGNKITNLDRTVVSVTDGASGTITAGKTYYYYFTPAVSGTFDVNSTMTGSQQNDLSVLDGCGGSVITENTNDSYNKVLTGIDVYANQTIIISYKSSSGSNRAYTLGFRFTASGGGGSAATECSNGSTPVKNSDRTFCLRKQMTVAGDMVSTGNALVVAPNSNNSSASNGSADCSTYSNGDYINNATENNADYKLCTYSVNGSTSLAETMAELVIPDAANSTIKYAALYVQSVINNDQIDNVVVKIARNGGTYQTVTKTYVDYDDFENTYDNFSLMGDVTNIFTTNNWKDGNYTVSVSNLAEGDTGSTGMYGAWNLVVIYENINKPMRSVSIFDGWKEIWGNEAFIPISGFYTPKIEPINAKVATFVAEGDATLQGDLFKAFRKSDYKWVDLKNTGQPASYPNQSSYSYVAIDGARTPDPINNNGIDVQNYDIGTGTTYNLLETEQTDINFKFTSTSDRYFPSMIAFSAEIYEPKLCYDYTLKQDNRYLPIDRNDVTAKIDTTISSSPVEILLYLRNKEADLSAQGISFTSDLNTTMFNVNQTANIQTSNPNGSGLIDRGFSNSNPCPLYDEDVSHATSNPGCTYGDSNFDYIRKDLGDLGSQEYIYAKYTVDPIGVGGLSDINESLHLMADYYITINGTKIVYNRYPLGSSKVPLCTPSNVYAPAWGQFNVVESKPEPNLTPQNNIKTQISRRPFNVDVAFDADPSTGTNDAPTSDIDTTVMVEMIDVDSFGDINASCANPDAGVSAPIVVPLTMTSTDNTDPVPSQNESYHNFALKNGAFRVWYFTDSDGNLIQNWTASTSDQGKTVDSISGLFNSAWHGDCNSSCGVSGGSSSSSDCFTCIKNYYGKPLCSRDNFSVRPEAFDVRIKDFPNPADLTTNTDLTHDIYGYAPDTTPSLGRMNLAAGYDYRYDLTATGNETNTSAFVPVPRYTRYFNGSNPDYNLTMYWDSALTLTQCNDIASRSLSAFLVNGVRTNQTNFQNQVGDYRLNMTDKSWTAVDQITANANRTALRGFDITTDCVLNSNSTQPDGSGEYGCEISSSHTNGGLIYKDHNLTLKPAKFDLSTFTYGLGKNMQPIVGGQGFVYMSDLNKTNDMNMSVRGTGEIRAVGANNSVLSNFVGGCFAKDLNISLEHDANLTYTTPFVARMVNSTLGGIQSHDTEEIALGGSYLTMIDDSNFTKIDSGALASALRFNFDRNQTIMHNPQTVSYGDINLSCTLEADCNSSAMRNLPIANTAVGTTSMNVNITHVYGKLKTNSVRVMGLIPFSTIAQYEIYNSPTLLGTGMIVDSQDGNWSINSLHTETTYGDATVPFVVPTSGSQPVGANSYANGVETYNFPAFTIRQGYRAHVDTEGWLWYGVGMNEYSDPSNPGNVDCTMHPCFDISFGRIIGNTGSAKTESETQKANKNTTSGTGWNTTSEYAPAIR